MFFVKFHPQPRDLSFTTLSVVQFFFVFGPELIFFDKTSLRSSIYRKKTLFNFKQTLFKIKQTLFNIRQGLYKTKRFPRFRVSEPIFIQTPHNFYTDPPLSLWSYVDLDRGIPGWGSLDRSCEVEVRRCRRHGDPCPGGRATYRAAGGPQRQFLKIKKNR